MNTMLQIGIFAEEKVSSIMQDLDQGSLDNVSVMSEKALVHRH
jgi:hypothetical protein